MLPADEKSQSLAVTFGLTLKKCADLEEIDFVIPSIDRRFNRYPVIARLR